MGKVIAITNQAGREDDHGVTTAALAMADMRVLIVVPTRAGHCDGLR
jgi:hypothetical protein